MIRRRRKVQTPGVDQALMAVDDLRATLDRLDARVVTATVSRPSFRFPVLQRDLALMGGGLIAAAALVGAGIGVALDVAIHRHRTA